MKSLNNKTKNEVGFFPSVDPGIVQYVEVFAEVKYTDYVIARSRIKLDLKRERIKLAKRRKPNLQSVNGGAQEFKITFLKKLAVLTGEDKHSEKLK